MENKSKWITPSILQHIRRQTMTRAILGARAGKPLNLSSVLENGKQNAR